MCIRECRDKHVCILQLVSGSVRRLYQSHSESSGIIQCELQKRLASLSKPAHWLHCLTAEPVVASFIPTVEAVFRSRRSTKSPVSPFAALCQRVLKEPQAV
ncbi:hypothetical protein V5799_011013 [Amblyomma americanum]|uniref:Uncharacterized protein n=1 Tax=Amblyomma americanum TaxID=6943 RepID=A0AAQ4EIE0_AMBAM